MTRVHIFFQSLKFQIIYRIIAVKYLSIFYIVCGGKFKIDKSFHIQWHSFNASRKLHSIKVCGLSIILGLNLFLVFRESLLINWLISVLMVVSNTVTRAKKQFCSIYQTLWSKKGVFVLVAGSFDPHSHYLAED